MNQLLTERLTSGSEEGLEREIESLSGEILHCYEEINVLYRLCEAVRDVFDERVVLERVLCEVARPLRAKGGWLVMVQERGLASSPVPLSRLRDAGSVPSFEAGAWASDRTVSNLAATCMSDGRIVAWDRDPVRRAPAIMAVPLQGAEGPLGALVFEKPLEEEAFRSGDRQLATAVAAYGATVVQNRRMARRVREAERAQNEIEVARDIQQRLLPAADPSIEGLDVAGKCLPAHDIGGDYFGYAPIADGRVLIAIADVAGHGIGAALGMVIARSMIRSEAHENGSPARILERVNMHLHRDLPDPGMYVTAFLLAYDPRSGRIEWACAGHPPPLLHRAADGTISPIDGEGLGLGIEGTAVYEEHSTRLDAGDALVLCTDGIVEVRNASSRMFGPDGIERALRASASLPAREIVAEIVDSAVRWKGSAGLSDDATVVVAKRVVREGN